MHEIHFILILILILVLILILILILVYKTKIECAIRGFHVYQKDWTPFEGEKIFCSLIQG